MKYYIRKYNLKGKKYLMKSMLISSSILKDQKDEKVHTHKFRRTLATKAIDKGMPIEQVQHLLGHTKIDTTLHYALVNQNNVIISHRKYICQQTRKNTRQLLSANSKCKNHFQSANLAL